MHRVQVRSKIKMRLVQSVKYSLNHFQDITNKTEKENIVRKPRLETLESKILYKIYPVKIIHAKYVNVNVSDNTY